MLKIILYFIVCLAIVTSITREKGVDNWFRGLKKDAKSGRSLNLPIVKPSKLFEEIAPPISRPPSFHGFESGMTSFDDAESNLHDSNDYPPSMDGEVSQDSPAFRYLLKPVTRKEYRCLNYDERQKVHEALLKTKHTMEGNVSQYDYFVSQHEPSKSPGAHFGPAFAPWHRHYLYQFEQVLRSHCSDCGIPFLDTRMESRLGGNPQHSILFSPQLAGNAVGEVTTGFAANWKAPGACKDIHPTVYREFIDHIRYLFDDDDVSFPARATSHEHLSMDWDETFELSHGYVHAAFGRKSHMFDLLCAPVDPLFSMHHSFIDNLFERARENIKRNNPPLKWADVQNLPPGSDASIASNHAPYATMKPFNIENSVGWLMDYSNAYIYEESPGDVTMCRSDDQCCGNGYSRFLWCNQATGRCLAKVMEGGTINPRFPSKACFCTGSSQLPFNQFGRCACRTRTFQRP